MHQQMRRPGPVVMPPAPPRTVFRQAVRRPLPGPTGTSETDQSGAEKDPTVPPSPEPVSPPPASPPTGDTQPKAGATKAGPPEAGAPKADPPKAAPSKPGAPCKITSKTDMPAPNGAPASRTTVGSNETVTFSTTGTATWTFTAGRAIGVTTGPSFQWGAPWSGSATITATIAGTPPTTCSIVMSVMPPTNMTMVPDSVDTYPIGTAGAGMLTTVTFHPLNVSFGILKWREGVGTTTGISGYFANYKSALVHSPNKNPVPILSSNTYSADHPGSGEFPSTPWKAGDYTFQIPNFFTMTGTGTEVTSMTTEQHVHMQDDGTVTISKLGANVTRKPSEATGKKHQGYPRPTPTAPSTTAGTKSSGPGGRPPGGGP